MRRRVAYLNLVPHASLCILVARVTLDYLYFNHCLIEAAQYAWLFEGSVETSLAVECRRAFGREPRPGELWAPEIFKIYRNLP